MKAISLLQPWASLVVLGRKSFETQPWTPPTVAEKQYETRSWATKYRGRLAIHASGSTKFDFMAGSIPFAEVLKQHGIERSYQLPHGYVIGEVTLVECLKMADMTVNVPANSIDPRSVSQQEWMFGDWSIGRWAWLFEDPIIYKTPVKQKGQLNVWNWDKPENTI